MTAFAVTSNTLLPISRKLTAEHRRLSASLKNHPRAPPACDVESALTSAACIRDKEATAGSEPTRMERLPVELPAKEAYHGTLIRFPPTAWLVGCVREEPVQGIRALPMQRVLKPAIRTWRSFMRRVISTASSVKTGISVKERTQKKPPALLN